MELRILSIAGPLIKVSITDGRRLILGGCMVTPQGPWTISLPYECPNGHSMYKMSPGRTVKN